MVIPQDELSKLFPFDRGDRVKKIKNLVSGENPYSYVTDIYQQNIKTDTTPKFCPNSDFVAAPPTTSELLEQLDGFVPTPEQAELLKNQNIYSIFDYLRHQASGEWVSEFVMAVELNFVMPRIQHFLGKMEGKLIEKHKTYEDTKWRLLIPASAQQQDASLTDSQKVWHENIPISNIRRDGGTQPRAAIHNTTVVEYAEQMKEGASFPPVTVFYDGTDYWLADGFHRVEAAEEIGLKEIAAEVKQGTRRDAVLYSVGANASHGLRRSNADKRRAVMTLLNDPEWSRWTQTDIAKYCQVSREYVNRLSKQLDSSCDRSQDSFRETTRNGVTYTIDTANIGSDSFSDKSQSNQRTKARKTSKTSASGKKQLQEGINYTPGCPGYACEYNVKVQRETWEQLKEYLELAGTLTLDAAIIRMFEALSDKPPKTDDICVATPSNVHRLHEHQIKAVGKTIAIREPEKAEIMATALAHNVEQAKAIIKAIAIIYPIAVRKVLEEG